jgi:hypothetical protein
MKKNCLITMAAVFLLSVTNGIQAQATQTKLDQMELMKQFIGTWKTEMGKDTTFMMEGKTFGKGLEFYWKTEIKGRIISEGKSIMGYDKMNKRIIEPQIWDSSPNIILWSGLFTSSKNYEAILLKDIPNPENASLKWQYEFKSHDLLICTYTVNKKTAATYNLNRK